MAPVALELEHLIGYNATYSGCAATGPDEYVHAAGATVLLSKVSDCHEQQLLRGHDDEIQLLRVSPSGSVLVTAQRGSNSDVLVWDLPAKSIRLRLTEHEGGVAAAAISGDERLLLTVGKYADGKVFVWDLSNGGVVATLRLPRIGQAEDAADCCWGGNVRDVKRRASDSYQFCILHGSQVLRYAVDPRTGVVSPQRRTDTSHVSRRWTCAAYSEEGELLLVGSESGDLVVIPTHDGVIAATHHVSSAGIRFICVAPTGRKQEVDTFQYARFGAAAERSCSLYVGGGAGSVVALRIADSSRPRVEELGRCEVDGPASALSIIDAGATNPELLVGTGAGGISRCCPLSAPSVSKLSAAALGSVHAVAFHSLQSDRFASASADGVVRVWDLSTYGELTRGVVGTGVGRRTRGTSMQADVPAPGKFGGQGGNVGGRDRGAAVGAAEPLSLSYIGQADILLSGWSDGAVRCFDALSGEQHWVLPTAHRSAVRTITHSDTLKFFITGGEAGEVKVWDIHTREMVTELSEHSGAVTTVTSFADGNHLLTASRDRSLLVWDLRTRRRVAQNVHAMGHVNGAVLSRNQVNVTSVASDKRLTLWDLRQNEPVKQVRYVSHYTDAAPVSIAADPSGRFVATGGTDEVVKLWEQDSLAELQTCPGHSGTVSCVRFAPDGKQLVSCGTDRSILVWNLFS
eukprot:TRINITY_DN32584_c0_g1_i1.p1 TRINITY_DN32584_c0_g1~~TRINITY_DN32584_c0_g1_i1.p1  ORF type:complete len:687 (+),score=106.10 TRINITY_DN32584_c0_g1_i1:79-2139(+)